MGNFDDFARDSTATDSTTARWAEPGGVVLTVTVPGDDPRSREQKVTDLVTSMKKLDRNEWTDLTKQFSYCGTLSALGRAEASGGSSSGSAQVSPTSTPVPDARTATTAP